MKRLCGLLLAVLVGFCCPLGAGATTSSLLHTGAVSEAGLSLSFPNEVILITRTGLDDAETRWLLWDGYLNPDSIKDQMEQEKACIYAYSLEPDFKMSVIIETSAFSEGINSLSQLSDRELQAYIEYLKQDGQGRIVDDLYVTRRDDCPQAIFLECGYDSEPVLLAYLTVFNGKSIMLLFTPIQGEALQDAGDYEAIFQSLRFDEEPVVPQPAHPLSWDHTDPITGAKMTVPAAWGAVEDERESAKGVTCFRSEDRQKNNIRFYTADLREELGGPRASRSHMDQDRIAPATVAGMLDVPVEELDKVTCAGTEFYHYATENTVDFYGVSYTEPHHAYMHIQDGYLYAFTCNFSADDPAFDSFTALVSSMVYPEIQESLGQRIEGFLSGPLPVLIAGNIIRTVVYATLFLSLLCILTVPLILFRFLRRKKAMKAATSLLTVIVFGAGLFVLCHFLFTLFPHLTYGTTLAGVIALLWGTGMYFLLHRGYRPPEGEEEPPAMTADSFTSHGENERAQAVEKADAVQTKPDGDGYGQT